MATASILLFKGGAGVGPRVKRSELKGVRGGKGGDVRGGNGGKLRGVGGGGGLGGAEVMGGG